MSTIGCEEARLNLPLLMYGELSFEAEEAVEQHLDGCTACRSEADQIRGLIRACDAAELMPGPRMLEAARAELRVRLEEEREREQIAALPALADRERRPAVRSRNWFENLFVAPWLKPVGALALLTVGFWAGRSATNMPPQVLTAGLSAEPIASRVRYVEPEASGRVQIVVEETRHRIVSGQLEDASIRGLLMSAAKDPADPGLRVETMDILKSRPEVTSVREVLLQALQTDPNPGVRLKALEGLKGAAAAPEVRAVLTRVLLADENPGVRTQAIDLLMQGNQREASTVGALQELMRREQNQYIRQRCQRALRDMNASLETF